MNSTSVSRCWLCTASSASNTFHLVCFIGDDNERNLVGGAPQYTGTDLQIDILQRDAIAWPNHQHRLEIAPHLRHLNLVPSIWRSPADPSRFEWEFLPAPARRVLPAPARRGGNGDRDTSRAIASSWSLRDILGGPPPAPGGGPSGLTLPPILDRVGNPAPVEAPLPRLSAAFSYQPTPAPTSDALERLRTYPLP